MKKLVLLLTFLWIVTISFGVEVVVHYHRFDGNYSGWNLWVWPHLPNSLEGKSYTFSSKDDFGMTASFELSDEVERAGIIVRLNEWQEKDVGIDRFFDTTNAEGTDNVVHVWLMQGVEQVFTEKPDTSPRVFFAQAVSPTEIRAFLSSAWNTKEWNGNIKVLLQETVLPIKEVSKTNPTDISTTKSITITLREALKEGQLSQPLSVAIQGYKEVSVVMTDVLDSFAYTGDLGCFLSDHQTEFKVWSPVSTTAKVLLFNRWDDEIPEEIIAMQYQGNGLWQTVIDRNLEGKFYLYQFTSYGQLRTTADIYSKAVTKNGLKSAIVDLRKTALPGWGEYQNPFQGEYEDAMIYEMHLADLTGDPSSLIDLPFTYLGVAQENTETSEGIKTGVNHIVELGVTHVHILPVMDFYTGDEADKNFETSYNWGYDPNLYFVPEGRYSTDPINPYTRIIEFKKMIQTFHNNGIAVILDAVFPHTFGLGSLSALDSTVPYYYYRLGEDGSFLNQSGCGNVTASERVMMRKLIVDSTKYWVDEYHVNGYRFDQMGLIDKTTMIEVEKGLHAIDPNIVIYGEPWGGLGVSALFGKEQIPGTNIAAFNDDFRDGIRGSVFEEKTKGFVMNVLGRDIRIKRGVVGSIAYDNRIFGFAADPEETINYSSSHDNHTLWDKNTLAARADTKTLWTESMLKDAQKLAATILFTAQGIPFIDAGQEFCRTKNMNSNSYNSPISVNALDWDRKKAFLDVFTYYQALIQIRSNHPLFRLKTAEEIKKSIQFLNITNKKIIGFTIENQGISDVWGKVLVLFNGSIDPEEVAIPQGTWNVIVDRNRAGEQTLYQAEGTVTVAPLSAIIAYIANSGNWAVATYSRLLRFIEFNGVTSPTYDPQRPPYVVFDWDQTSIINDTEESLFRYQIENLLYRMTPEVFAQAIRKDLPKTPFSDSFRNAAGESVNIDLIGEDLDTAYKFLYNNYKGFDAGGTKSLEEIRTTQEFIDFRAKLAWLLEAIYGTFSVDVGYPWLLYLFSGMTVEQVQSIAEKSIDSALTDKLETYTLSSSQSLPTKTGYISLGGYKRGLRTLPEISNLMNVLRAHGIQVYVCTASLDNVIRVFAGLPKYGYNLPPENVIGMRVAMENGVYIPQYDETWVQTQQAGKAEAIRRVLVEKYGYGPIAIFGDSQGDYQMSQAFQETQIVLVINRLRTDDFGMLALQALQTLGQPDAKYLLQGRDENLGVFRPDEATIRYGKTEAELLHPSLASH